VFNDVSILLDALSPYLSAVTISYKYPFVSSGPSSSLRILSLCLSGAFRALCGVAAGGSKAALTMHFASDGKGTGDVGDLSAKDASKETVLALFGMLAGTVVMHYVDSARTTYTVLVILTFCHLSANYLAVRVVTMRSLNRQRANVVWMAFRSSSNAQNKNGAAALVLTPEEMATREYIFFDPSALYDATMPRTLLGHCHVGSAFKAVMSSLSTSQLRQVLDIFSDEMYILWYSAEAPDSSVLHICLKHGHTPPDHLKGWAHAQELALASKGKPPRAFEERLDTVRATLVRVTELFAPFLAGALTAGWKIEEGGLLAGSPRTISVECGSGDEAGVLEDRKNV
ncbi:vitamin B6 photo-protection and homoeostasis-domain-containing protein, partial [Amylocystis lapponica]